MNNLWKWTLGLAIAILVTLLVFVLGLAWIVT